MKLTLTLFTVLLLPLAARAAQPNVVYLLADDLGWGDLSVNGGSIPTPRHRPAVPGRRPARQLHGLVRLLAHARDAADRAASVPRRHRAGSGR